MADGKPCDTCGIGMADCDATPHRCLVCTRKREDQSIENHLYNSMLDTYATQAMQGMLASGKDDYVGTPQFLASCAFDLAQAMIVEYELRKKPTDD